MGKRIIQQRRGRGTHTYRVRRKAFNIEVRYPGRNFEGEGEILRIIHSAGHNSPLAKILIKKEKKDLVFYNIAPEEIYEGQKINVGGKEVKIGNIMSLKDIPTGTEVFNIESHPGDGGRFIRSGGSRGIVHTKNKEKNKIIILMPSKKQKEFKEECRATVGIVAGGGKKEKPMVKAGNKYHKMKSRNKLWPRTSAVKMNVIDHPFGSGRGKRIKRKIAKRNAPPGRKVGLLRPRRTGRKKR